MSASSRLAQKKLKIRDLVSDPVQISTQYPIRLTPTLSLVSLKLTMKISPKHPADRDCGCHYRRAPSRWLAFSGYGANKSYYVTIAELGGMGDKAYHSQLRVEGFVQPGSIEQDGTHVDLCVERV